MTFTAIDAFVEHGDARVVLACDQCQEQVIAFDTLDPESVQAFEATEAHSCPPSCLLCGEILPLNDRIIGARIDLDCWRDQPREAALALGAFIEVRKMVQA